MKNIKFVFFDIGYTLINEDDVWTLRCREQAETNEAKILGLSPSQIYQEIVKASMTYQPQYRTVIKKFGFTSPAPYRHYLEKLYPDTIPVLQLLSAKYKLGIIANQTDGLCDRLKNWEIFKYFSLIISSWDYQIMKPDSRIFQTAVEKSGCKPSETIMIGDRLDNDIFPAKAIGMNTIWIKQGFGSMQIPKSEDYLPDTEISSLSDLLHIL
jgi:haloacid dehalogenase superfamily, subfamily IA, variant 3 with third motif having DD or ED/haloacid dehalogenase superfamily, subfamily IA, variant 1 with third motif having Dx(3-4)D or Dx(3-4)E